MSQPVLCLSFDARGVWLCSCLRCWHTAQVPSNTTTCPSCGLIATESPRSVSCADVDHNEPGGCGNTQCWKHAKQTSKQRFLQEQSVEQGRE